MNRTGRKLARHVTRMLARKDMNAGDVVLRWRELPDGDYDPVLDAGNPAFAPQEKSETKRAFIHESSIGTTGFIRHAVIKQGDVILDFPGDVQIDNRQDLQFEIGGVIYVQKNGGDELAKSWDVRCGGTPIVRTVLVTPKA